MKKLVLLIIFISSASALVAGCPGLKITTSNGINLGTGFNEVDTIHVNSPDSISIFLKAGNGCYIFNSSVTLDNGAVSHLLLKDGTYFPEIRLLSKPGTYRVTAFIGGAVFGSQMFTILLNPVGLHEQLQYENELQVFPNPADGALKVSSEKPLTSLKIFNSVCELIHSFIPSENLLEIRLENYAPGVYFLHAAILNERTVIKKISVL